MDLVPQTSHLPDHRGDGENHGVVIMIGIEIRVECCRKANKGRSRNPDWKTKLYPFSHFSLSLGNAPGKANAQ